MRIIVIEFLYEMYGVGQVGITLVMDDMTNEVAGAVGFATEREEEITWWASMLWYILTALVPGQEEWIKVGKTTVICMCVIITDFIHNVFVVDIESICTKVGNKYLQCFLVLVFVRKEFL